MTWTDLTDYPYDPNRTMPVQAEPKWNDLFRDNATYLYNRIVRPVTILDRSSRIRSSPYRLTFQSFGNDIIVTTHNENIGRATSIQLDTRDPVLIGRSGARSIDDIFVHIFFNVDAGNHTITFTDFGVWRSLEVREIL